MKQSKIWTPIAATLIGVALLLTACGQKEPIAVCPPFMTAETERPTVAAWDYFPQMEIHYEDENFESAARLTLSDIYTWGATMADGAHGIIECDGARPYQMEDLCTVTLADTVGEVRLAYFPEEMNAIVGAEFYAAEALTGLTLTAYPPAKDGTVDLTPEKAQSIPVANGRFTLLVGRYYYELTVPHDNGLLTYGFIAHRIDAEEYQIINHWDGGCCVEIEYEDPDHMIKDLFYDDISLYRPHGREGNAKSGMTLFPTGKITHTYTNHAGTVIFRHTDLGDPMAEEDMHFVTTSCLNIDYEIEWPWNHKVTAAQYDRYTHDGTLVDGKTLIAADVKGTDTVHLEPNFYYVFTVYYEDLSAQYVLKTGEGVDEIAPHPMDDPSIDPSLAKYLRAEHIHCMHTALDSLDTVNVYIYRYLGQIGGMEAVIFEEPDHFCRYLHSDEAVILGDQRLVLPDGRQLFFYHTHRFYRPEEAYKNGWITDADVSAMIELFPEIVPTHQLVSEGDPLLLLTRSLPGTGTAREIRLTPLGADGVDLSLGKQLYRAEGIYTMKYAEAPAQFEVQCDPTLAAKYVAITRYALIDPTHGKNILLHNGSLTLEAGYYYEFEVVCESEKIRYGLVTASERTVPTSPTDPHEVALHYTENGVKKQTTITKSLSSTRWTEWGEVSETAVATPYQMPDLCRINATQASVTLQEGMEIAAFVITATPVDENGKYLPNAEKTSFTVDDNTFALLEGSHYYAVYVCFDGSSFTRYSFIAHYDP